MSGPGPEGNDLVMRAERIGMSLEDWRGICATAIPVVPPSAEEWRAAILGTVEEAS